MAGITITIEISFTALPGKKKEVLQRDLQLLQILPQALQRLLQALQSISTLSRCQVTLLH
jgi:hypothetical protein